MGTTRVPISGAATTKEIVNRLKEKYPLPESDGGWARVRDDPDFFETLCHAIGQGHSVTDFCDSVGLMPTRVNAWLNRLSGPQKDLYDAARESRAQYMAERILKVMEEVKDGTLPVPQARTVVDALKWHAERLDPQHWGSKLQVQAEIRTTTEMHLEAVRELAERIRAGDDRPVIEGYVEPKLTPEKVKLPKGALLDKPPVREGRKPKKTREQITEEARARRQALKDELLS